MTAFVQDLRNAVRSFCSAPLFFAGAIATLALGIGANGAVFSILQAVLLQPLPYTRPDEVVMVWRTRANPPPAGSPNILAPGIARSALTGEMAFAWREQSRDVLSSFAAVLSWQGNLEAQFDLTLSDRTERLRGAFATANFFDVLGVSAAQGRVFTPSDESSNEPLLVLSHGLWQRAFGGDPGVIGRSLTLVAGRPRTPKTFTVIGVLPAAFRFTYPQETEAWAVEPWSEVQRYGGAIGFRAVARIKPGLTLAAANAHAATIRTGLDYPNTRPEDRDVVRLEPIKEWIVGETRPSLMLLAGVSLLLLLMTCATVANALFMRVTERQHELAARASLGAEPPRLRRQLLTEGFVLSAAGTVTGTFMAVLLGPVLRAIMPPSIPRVDEIGISPSILGFAVATATITTMLSALAPAWRGTRIDVTSTLKRGAGTVSTDRSTARWRGGIVGFQSAVATMLLVSAVLLLDSLWHLKHVPLGFDGERVLTFEMRLLDDKYMPYRPPSAPGQPRAVGIPSASLVAFQQDLVNRLSGLPGVLQVGLTSAVPFRGTDFARMLTRVGEWKRYFANARYVDPAYFSVMRIDLVRGRLFSDVDKSTSPKVMLISESYARQMFGSEDPIGKLIDNEGPVAVIGVVRDVRYARLDKEPLPAIYLPRAQEPSELICVVARTAPNAGDLGSAIRRVVRELDPAIPVMNLTFVDRIISDSTLDRSFYTTATSAFAIVALLLTAIGLIVIVARSIVDRRREFAIRAALGATTPRLVGLVVQQGMTPVVVGTAVGLAGAYWGATVLTQFMFQVTPRDPVVYGAVMVFIMLVAAVASLVPTNWITDRMPADVLRAE